VSADEDELTQVKGVELMTGRRELRKKNRESRKRKVFEKSPLLVVRFRGIVNPPA